MQLASKADGSSSTPITAREDARQSGVDRAVSRLYQDKPQRLRGTETLEEGAHEAVRVTLLGSDPDRCVHTLGKRNDPW
jgi:hypothetical protein